MERNQIERLMKRAGRIHFIGIGGISMSSLAMITLKKGYEVSGSDRNVSALTEHLAAAGAEVHYRHDAAWVQGASLVVYTAAVHADNPEWREAERFGIPICSRADYFGWLMYGYRERIGVAGTHGKSTVTSMIAEIFLAAEADPTVVSGAELSDLGGAYRLGGEEYFIFEACEYCDSFLSFCPTTAVITNIEYDHADYFKTMDQLRASFRQYVGYAGRAVLNFDDPESVALAASYPGEVVSYAMNASADYTADEIAWKDGCASFTLIERGRPSARISLSVPGRHNIMDALAASAASLAYGVSPEAVTNGLGRFRGAKRRFEYMGRTACGALVYNDYAHHPSEIRSTLSAAKLFGKRVVCVFQPHTYSRTAALFDDFSQAFREADCVILADIYAAREENRYGITSADLAKKTPGAVYLPDRETIRETLLRTTGDGDMILILGAGDIITLGPTLIEGGSAER